MLRLLDCLLELLLSRPALSLRLNADRGIDSSRLGRLSRVSPPLRVSRALASRAGVDDDIPCEDRWAADIAARDDGLSTAAATFAAAADIMDDRRSAPQPPLSLPKRLVVIGW